MPERRLEPKCCTEGSKLSGRVCRHMVYGRIKELLADRVTGGVDPDVLRNQRRSFGVGSARDDDISLVDFAEEHGADRLLTTGVYRPLGRLTRESKPDFWGRVS